MGYRFTALAMLFLLWGASSGCRLLLRLPDEITDPRIREVHGLGEIPEDETWWMTRDRRRKEQDKLLFNFPLTQAWKQEFQTSHAITGTPVIGTRQIFLSRGPQGLIKLNMEDGIPVWSLAPAPGEVFGPLVDADGLLVCSTSTGRILAVEPSRPGIVWESTHAAERPGNLAVGGGRIFYPVGNGTLLALSARDGGLEWRQETEGELAASPLVDEIGQKVYCGTLEGTMVCLDAETGVIRWRYDAGSAIHATPLLTDGKLCFGSDDGDFHCLDALEGRRHWVKSTGASIRATPAVSDKQVIFGSWDGFLYAVDLKNGRTRWKSELPSRMELPPVCIDELVLVTGLRSPELTALQSEDGRPAGSFKLEHLDAWFTTSPVISDDRFLYAGTSRGKLIAMTEIIVEEMTEEEASRARFEELLGRRREAQSDNLTATDQDAAGPPAGRH